jgi:hypothetical protein
VDQQSVPAPWESDGRGPQEMNEDAWWGPH